MNLQKTMELYCDECGAEIEGWNEYYRVGKSSYCTRCVHRAVYEPETVEEYYADDLRDRENEREEFENGY